MAAESNAGVYAVAGEVGGGDRAAADQELDRVGAVLAAGLIGQGPIGFHRVGNAGVKGDVLINSVGPAGIRFEPDCLRGDVAAAHVELDELIGGAAGSERGPWRERAVLAIEVQSAQLQAERDGAAVIADDIIEGVFGREGHGKRLAAKPGRGDRAPVKVVDLAGQAGMVQNGAPGLIGDERGVDGAGEIDQEQFVGAGYRVPLDDNGHHLGGDAGKEGEGPGLGQIIDARRGGVIGGGII